MNEKCSACCKPFPSTKDGEPRIVQRLYIGDPTVINILCETCIKQHTKDSRVFDEDWIANRKNK